jgi:hypothetical protein
MIAKRIRKTRNLNRADAEKRRQHRRKNRQGPGGPAQLPAHFPGPRQRLQRNCLQARLIFLHRLARQFPGFRRKRRIADLRLQLK